MPRLATFALLLAGACTGADDRGNHRGDPPSDPSSTSTGTPSGTSTGTTSTSTSGSTTTTVPTDPCVEPDVVRYVALGDAGTGSADQFAVADAMEQVCNSRCCDFALYLGDNFYNSGVDGPDDSLFIDYFEAPYANLDFPFYVALGNHDYGAEGLGIEFWKGGHYLDYAADYTTNFTFPDLYYDFQVEHVKFLALNTTEIFFGLSGAQGEWVDDQFANLDPSVDHVVMFGHHPYISNGRHGNAGAYEGIPFIPIVSGESVRDFFDDHVCGNALLYYSGHDHNRQLLEPTCGTEFIVSGAGAKTTDLEGRGNVTFFEDDTIEGFVWTEIRGNQVTVAFYDKNQVLEYEQVFNL